MYKDRGIMKWAPFDALNGFQGLIKELKDTRSKKVQPTYTQDVLNEFSITINEALNTNKTVEIEYFQDGYFKKNVDKIKMVNMIERVIIFNSLLKIKMSDVIDIKI